MLENTNRLLSIVVPAHNEEKTLAIVIEQVVKLELPFGYTKEILIFDDGSVDTTYRIMESLHRKYPGIVKIFQNELNLGKTRTTIKGILLSLGEYVVIQDADLEYDPSDIISIFQSAIDTDSDVVYGNRFTGKNPRGYLSFFLGNILLSSFSNLFTFWRIGKIIPDMEVCYKLVKGEIIREVAKKITAQSSFGFEPEVTAKLSRYRKEGRSLKFEVVPISYAPRSKEEGKKVTFLDGIKAIGEIIKYNLF